MFWKALGLVATAAVATVGVLLGIFAVKNATSAAQMVVDGLEQIKDMMIESAIDSHAGGAVVTEIHETPPFGNGHAVSEDKPPDIIPHPSELPQPISVNVTQGSPLSDTAIPGFVPGGLLQF